MLDAETPFRPDPAPGHLAGDAEAPADPVDAGTDHRVVTPRRPLRFTAARSPVEAPAVALPVPNLFATIFDSDATLTDDRVKRGRARIRHLMAAHEAGLQETERNFWYDDPALAPAGPQTDAEDAARTETAAADIKPAGRRVRHLTAADIAPRQRPVRKAGTDTLHAHLHALRTEFYAPDPDTPTPAVRPSLPQRLTAQVLNIILVIVALPVGVAVAAFTLWRGENLRLSALAMTVTGFVLALMQATHITLL